MQPNIKRVSTKPLLLLFVTYTSRCYGGLFWVGFLIWCLNCGFLFRENACVFVLVWVVLVDGLMFRERINSCK